MLGRIVGEDFSLHINLAPNLPLVRADEAMLEQVLMNLVVNARDAMPAGGNLVIATSEEAFAAEYETLNPQRRPCSYVRLSVTDSGCGIAPEILPRIFEPFFTTKPLGKGTGLGLATVYSIVKQHQGWINVQSELDRGTTFHVYFPALRTTDSAQSAEATDEEIRGGSETILIVEDEVPVSALMRNVLERHGYTVMEAASGKAALELWKDHRKKIDLVITDIVMPDHVNGPELVAAIHADSPSLPFIYTSGYSADVVGPNIVLSEGLNFLQKPFSPQRLCRAVRDLLD
jgi:two-component system, cell cycle sensor histidine kinase and response regulator CckA